MLCKKCEKEMPADATFCCYCGQRLVAPPRKPKSRGNGQGSVYQLPSGKYRAEKVLGYYLEEDGKKKKKTVTKTFAKKKDAVAALPTLGISETASGKASKKAKTTFKELYDLWIKTHEAGRDTLNCYKAAIKYFQPVFHEKATDVEIEDLQECISECPRGKATRRNMKTVAGLVYKYGIPRGYFPEKLNLAEYLVVKGEEGIGGAGLPEHYLEAIRKATGRSLAADYVYCQCYLGFRPSELLALDVSDYDQKQKVFVGGAKTEAGKNRMVTVSPKIQPIIDRIKGGRSEGAFFQAPDGSRLDIKQYRDMFYSLLEELELGNPTYQLHDQKKHTYTPHSCRHTFATLMKRVDGSTKDKLRLIGHSSEEMLHYYEDYNLDDLRKITDKI